jgi:hypothetical protein
MLWAVVILVLVLWALGLITGTTMSGFIHILLLVALVFVIVEVVRISARRRA